MGRAPSTYWAANELLPLLASDLSRNSQAALVRSGRLHRGALQRRKRQKKARPQPHSHLDGPASRKTKTYSSQLSPDAQRSGTPRPVISTMRRGAVTMRTGLSASELGAVVREAIGLAKNNPPKLDHEEERSSVLGSNEAERMPGRVEIEPKRRRS